MFKIVGFILTFFLAQQISSAQNIDTSVVNTDSNGFYRLTSGEIDISKITNVITNLHYGTSINSLRYMNGTPGSDLAVIPAATRLGDGGGGIFDCRNSTANDNGGTIVNSFNGKRWYRVYSGTTLNAAWFEGISREVRIGKAIKAAMPINNLSPVPPSVLVPADMIPYSYSNAIVGIAHPTWVRMIREGGEASVYDVKAYGAKGMACEYAPVTDWTDDSAAIQAAIDAAHDDYGSQRGRSTVYLPAGTYWISRQLSLPHFTHLTGAGPHMTFIQAIPQASGKPWTGNYCMVQESAVVEDQTHPTPDASALQIDGIAFDGCNLNKDMIGIRLGFLCYNQHNHQLNYTGNLRNVRVRNCNNIGIDLYANVAELQDVYVDDCGYGLRLAGMIFRGTRIQCQGSRESDLRIQARLAELHDVHIETNPDLPVHSPVWILHSCGNGSQCSDNSLNLITEAVLIDGLTISYNGNFDSKSRPLIMLDKLTKGCSIRNIALLKGGEGCLFNYALQDHGDGVNSKHVTFEDLGGAAAMYNWGLFSYTQREVKSFSYYSVSH